MHPSQPTQSPSRPNASSILPCVILIAILGLMILESPARAQFQQHVLSGPCTACEATSVYATDLDGDGDTDILSASQNDNKIAWYENDGDPAPSFTPHTITTDAQWAQSVHAADVDGDGDVDVLSASNNDDKIAWYENDGSADPSFTSHTITENASFAQSVFAADIDADGDTDVLSASTNDDKIAWYENDGSANPSFTVHTISITADRAQDIHAADVNGDGDIDVLSASEGDDTVVWYENDGNETFSPDTITTSASFVQSVHTVDLDGDSDTDVLSAPLGDDQIVWYENDGNENFTANPLSTINNPRSVYATDVNGDENVDIVAVASGQGEVVWYESDGSPDPTFTTHTISTNVRSAYSTYAADVNGNGSPDVLSASLGDDKIAWYENTGNGAFSDQESVNAVPEANNPSAVRASDVDSDGDTDVLSASLRDDKIVWYENDGTSPPTFSAHTITTNAENARSVAAADVNGDGDTDIISPSGFESIAWYENDGSETFTAQTISTTVSGPRGLLAADVNEDGAIDILSAAERDDKIAWYENDGGTPPSFTEHVITTNAAAAKDVYATDVDGDSDIDVLSASFSDDKIAWYENDGSDPPSFQTHTITTNAGEARSVYAADLDGDGDTDVLAGAAELVWHENDGSENFTAHALSTDRSRSAFASDLTGNGYFDVLSARAASSEVVLYENDCTTNSSFTAQPLTGPVDRPGRLYAADLDGDADMDVLSVSESDDVVAWHENQSEQDSLCRPFQNPDTPPAAGTSPSIEINTPPVLTPTNGTLFYRRAGAPEFQDTTLDLSNRGTGPDTSTSVEIPSDVVTNAGVQYFVELAGTLPDGRDTLLTVPAAAPASTGFLPVQFDQVTADGPFDAETYRMLTVPVALETRSVLDVLQNQYGPYDPGNWRLARWTPGDSTYTYGTAVDSLRPGEAIWLITAGGDELTIHNGQSVDATGPRPIDVDPGWNQVGNPFSFPVAWNQIEGTEGVQAPVAYDTSGYQFDVPVLQPWEGVFIYNPSTSATTLRVPPVEASESLSNREPTRSNAHASNGSGPTDYRLRATARAHVHGQPLLDRATWLGFAEGAENGVDPQDRAKPPAVGSHVRLHVTPDAGPPLARSIKPPAGEGAAWDLHLGLSPRKSLSSPQPVTIAFAEEGHRPNDFRRYVLDQDREIRLPMTNSSVQVSLTKDRPVRHLRVLVGTEAFAEHRSDDVSLSFETTKLHPNVPNPFRTETTISYQLAESGPVKLVIYDLLGRRVETLVDKEQEAGIHQVQWDPQRGNGRPLASGVYFCRMTAGDLQATQKLMMIR